MALSSAIKPVLCSGAVGVAALIGLASPAMAADQIEFIYQTTTVTISTDEIKDFAETGAVPADLQVFFDETAQIPENIRTLLTDSIRIPRFVESFLESPTGEFVLLQLDQTISSSGSGDLESLQTAFSTAGSDRDISVLELLEVYPESEVRLNLTDLESVYNRVNNFIVNVQPAIDTAIEFLQDIVCECDSETAADLDMDEEASVTPDEELQSVRPTDTVTTGSKMTCQTHQLTEGLLDVRALNQEPVDATDTL
ncbi:MAG: alpha/beta hydrolase [Cyanothece sp. SIO2G6]|nr:alpha/beta hydrolase [Cyanothece sp. SIO2G6]